MDVPFPVFGPEDEPRTYREWYGRAHTLLEYHYHRGHDLAPAPMVLSLIRDLGIGGDPVACAAAEDAANGRPPRWRLA